MTSWKSFVADHGRGSAAVAVLIVLPFAQLFQSRIAPVFVGVAILIIAVALLVTGRFKLQEGLANAVSDIRKNWALLASFFAIVVYAAVSAMWAPDRTLAIKSALTLALLPICVAILSHQFHLIPFVRLPVVLLLGCLSASIALTAPYFFQVQWFAFMGREAELFDLNRIAVLLAGLLFCVPLIRLETQNWRIAKAIIVVLGIVAIFRSESEVAKISALAFVLTFGVLYLLPRLTQVLVGSAIFLFCAFPMLVPLISSAAQRLPGSLLEGGNAAHRLAIWAGYSEHLTGALLFGHGLKSDKVHGLQGLIDDQLLQAGFPTGVTSPHNTSLEIWYTLGLLGAVLGGILIFQCSRWAKRNGGDKQKQVFSLFICWYVATLLSASFTQGWYLATTAIVWSVAAALLWQRSSAAADDNALSNAA